MSRILVVDDEPDIRLLLRLELSAEGHQVIEAANGQEALDVIAATPPDLMLLDLMMPIVDGWGVLRSIDAEDVPPIVVITAMNREQDTHIAELLELGAIDVITKPFDLNWLSRLVDAVLLVDRSERDEYRRRRLAKARGM